MKAVIWLGCYASYNDGYLFDKRYTVETPDELNEAIEEFQKHVLKCIKTERPEWVADGYINDETYAEEIYLADYEVYIDDQFFKIDFGESVYDLRQFLEAFDGASFNHEIELLIKIANNEGRELTHDDLSDIDDNYLVFEVDSDSDADLSYAYTDMTGMLDDSSQNETLVRYFDHESFGRDLKCDGIYIIETNNSYYAVSS